MLPLIRLVYLLLLTVKRFPLEKCKKYSGTAFRQTWGL